MKHRIGALSIDAAFALTQLWTVLFAPSGAGKTTILRAISGLLKPQHARIVLHGKVPPQDGRRMNLDFLLTNTTDGVFIKPHQRSIRMVGQNTALFPHLSVLQNIRYKLFISRDREENRLAEDHLRSLLSLCRVEHLTTKKPAQLSGGERQRVALARALAPPDCNLLLLDEPFTGLDTQLRDELIVDLRSWLDQNQIPVLSVTHDIGEAFLLNAEIIRLHEGGVIQQGPVAQVLAAERGRLIARLR